MARMSWRISRDANDRDHIRREEESAKRDDIQVIVAALVVPELAEVLSVLKLIAEEIALLQSSPEPDDSDEILRALRHIGWLTPQIELPVCAQVRERLDYLPNGRGRHVAHAMGRIEKLAQHTKAISEIPRRNIVLDYMKHVKYEYILGLVADAMRQGIGWPITQPELGGLRPFMERAAETQQASNDP